MRSLTGIITASVVCGLLTLSTSVDAQTAQERIDQVQKEIDEQGLEWTAGHTSATAMDLEEFHSRLIPLDQMYQVPEDAEIPSGGFVPPEVFPEWVPRPAPEDPVFSWHDVDGEDWTSPVANQLNCGACTVFAAVASIEGTANVSFGASDLDLDLSEQNLLDCAGVSCNGGGMDAAQGLNRAQNYGVCDEACQPYEAVDGSCEDHCADFDARKIYVTEWGTVADSMFAYPTDEEIKNALSWGPVTTSMTVYSDFMTYTSGVYQKTASATQEGGHSLVLIGWNDENDSWYGKNSWGTAWGQDGFFEIKRGEAGFGGWFTAWCHVDASQITGVFEVTEDWMAASLQWDSGDTDQSTTVLQRTYGDQDMQFWIEVNDAPWVTAEPASGTLGTEDLEITFTFDEANWDSNQSLTKTRKAFIIGEHGLSREVEVRLTVYGGPDADSDSDSDSDVDTDTDADSDTDTDVDTGATDSGDDSGGCGCSHAGAATQATTLVDLVVNAL